MDTCTGTLTSFTYDAMWCEERASCVEVPDISPDDSHIHREYNNMADSNKPKPNDIPIDVDQIKAKAEEVYSNTPPEVKQAVESSKGFYEENKQVIHAVLVGAVVLKVYKRKVAKASAKAVVKAIKKSGEVQPFATQAEPLTEILGSLTNVPNMVYIPRGGGMAHVLAAKDVVVTAFGNFEQMTNDEIFDYIFRSMRFR